MNPSMLLAKKTGTLIGNLLLVSPLLVACHGPIEGENIDVPPERPGRFLPEAAPAEAKAAEQEENLREAQAAREGKPAEAQPPKPEERYETLPDAGSGAAGSMETEDGHTVTPQTQAIYGKPSDRSSGH
ncbi:hypothetical protein [Acetobacter sp. AAB5]|uniref:hypothetical protein n=1 Tax=Acetobacter sp. AAB5 TaxID=3418370 RepID=UPI003CEA9CA6